MCVPAVSRRADLVGLLPKIYLTMQAKGYLLSVLRHSRIGLHHPKRPAKISVPATAAITLRLPLKASSLIGTLSSAAGKISPLGGLRCWSALQRTAAG